MIYSNQILRKGLVKIPVLPQGLAWDIKTEANGDAYLHIVGAERCVTSYYDQLRIQGTPNAPVNQLKEIERVAMSLMAEFMEDAYAAENSVSR